MGSTMSNSYYDREFKREDMMNDFEQTFNISLLAPRCRSFEISLDEPLLETRGRCGAGNMEQYLPEIKEIVKHPDYIDSGVWDEDETFMFFRFKLNEEKWINFVKKWKLKESL